MNGRKVRGKLQLSNYQECKQIAKNDILLNAGNFVTTRRSTIAVYYALIADAKVKACVSNFPLDVC